LTEYGDGPTFIQIDYTSAYAPHSMRLHATEWNPVPITGGMGSFTNWNGTPRDAEEMIDDFLLDLKELMNPYSTITLATIFTKPTESAPSIPVASKSLAIVGTNALTTHDKAIQSTVNMRTTLFHPVKLVSLDVPHDGTNFDKQNISTAGTSYVAVYNELRGDDNAWCGKDGAQIGSLISITWNINQALRKQYGMG
jgi:hypothetical protein